MDSSSPVGWLCLLPPLLTIGLAIVSKRVVASLLVGIAVAVAIMLPTYAAASPWFQSGSSSSPAPSGLEYAWSLLSLYVVQLGVHHLWASLRDFDHLLVFAFTSLLGIQVALIHRIGGMHGVVAWAAPLARSRRGGQVLTWMLGMALFIDDYANTLLLGSTMRPLTDRLKISREKLAFLVDSTAAPVAGIALVSTWVATEISTMQVGYADAGLDIGGATFGLFVQTIPSRFYILYMLVFVLLCGLLGRDFGPMLQAERAALASTEDLGEPEGDNFAGHPRALNAILPVAVTVAVVIGLLIATGTAELEPGTQYAATIQFWGQVIGQGNSYLSLFYGALAGLLTVLGLAALQAATGWRALVKSAVAGFLHVLPAMVILWLAWTLSGLTGSDHLRTGEFVAAKLGQLHIAAGFMPTIVFVLASGIAFATGTSWGTMAILIPIAIPLVYGLLAQQLGQAPPADHFVLLATIGSVLAGAIFGDHCSPISDTTILSSRSSHCHHIAHVRTQIPYALAVGAISILCGTLPSGFGISSWLLLPLGCAAILLLLLVVGRKAQ